jgi:hypothetical protein
MQQHKLFQRQPSNIELNGKILNYHSIYLKSNTIKASIPIMRPNCLIEMNTDITVVLSSSDVTRAKSANNVVDALLPIPIAQ